MGVKTWQLGLTGYPLGHSLSPRLHEAALSACGLAGEYRLFPVENPENLALLLEKLRSGELDGLNVTIPYKQVIAALVDQLSSQAALVGAANTLVMRNERLVGENTDVDGFRNDLQAKWDFSGKPLVCLILGAGGAGRAAATALLADGWQIQIAARRKEQALEMAQAFTKVFSASQIATTAWARDALQDAVWKSSLLVNATPVGMPPWEDQDPLPTEVALHKGLHVYDLIYNPAETRLMKRAVQAGCPTVNGVGMLVRQAAAAFSLWTGEEAPLKAMKAAVNEGKRNDLITEEEDIKGDRG